MLVLASRDGRLPECVYWSVGPPAGENFAALAASRPLAPAMLDRQMEASLCPEPGRGWSGTPGQRGHRADGSAWTTQFVLEEVDASDTSIKVRANDAVAGLRLEQTLAMHRSAVVEARSRLTNEGDTAYRLDWLACPVLPVPDGAREMIGFAGRWCGEFQDQRLPFTRGAHLRENRRGRTGHDGFPALIVPLPGCTEHHGEAYGFHLGWSGNHRLVAEEVSDGRKIVMMGPLLEPGEVTLAPGETFETPPLYAAFSALGLNGLSNGFHWHARTRVLPARSGKPRPVHFNTWEAVYFDHDVATLDRLADEAAAMGAERFVLDDGWFGRRDDDTTSLGDWRVDERKYPSGLKPLVDHLQTLGLGFGLWIEPEMVNLDSDLARAHPDWVAGVPGYEPVPGRSQHVLDLTNRACFEHILERLDALVAENRIEYLKWDMNRDLVLQGDAKGRPATHRQTLAVYELIDRLRAAHPDIEIETCASGGGRVDYGILARTDRVWLSDSNDARERWRMQRAASYFLPPEIVGSHVGPRVCHTSGRVLPIETRALVAASRWMGCELDLRDKPPEEREVLARVLAWHKTHRDRLHGAIGRRHHRLERAANVTAELFIDETDTSFLLFAYQEEANERTSAPPLRLCGLQAGSYRIERIFPRDLPHMAHRGSGAEDTVTLSGIVLMRRGVVLPNAFPDTLFVYQGELERE